MAGFPNKPIGVCPTKNDQHLGCEMGVFPPLKETPNMDVSENRGTPKCMV